MTKCSSDMAEKLITRCCECDKENLNMHWQITPKAYSSHLQSDIHWFKSELQSHKGHRFYGRFEEKRWKQHTFWFRIAMQWNGISNIRANSWSLSRRKKKQRNALHTNMEKKKCEKSLSFILFLITFSLIVWAFGIVYLCGRG